MSLSHLKQNRPATKQTFLPNYSPTFLHSLTISNNFSRTQNSYFINKNNRKSAETSSASNQIYMPTLGLIGSLTNLSDSDNSILASSPIQSHIKQGKEIEIMEQHNPDLTGFMNSTHSSGFHHSYEYGERPRFKIVDQKEYLQNRNQGQSKWNGWSSQLRKSKIGSRNDKESDLKYSSLDNSVFRPLLKNDVGQKLGYQRKQWNESTLTKPMFKRFTLLDRSEHNLRKKSKESERNDSPVPKTLSRSVMLKSRLTKISQKLEETPTLNPENFNQTLKKPSVQRSTNKQFVIKRPRPRILVKTLDHINQVFLSDSVPILFQRCTQLLNLMKSLPLGCKYETLEADKQEILKLKRLLKANAKELGMEYRVVAVRVYQGVYKNLKEAVRRLDNNNNDL